MLLASRALCWLSCPSAALFRCSLMPLLSPRPPCLFSDFIKGVGGNRPSPHPSPSGSFCLGVTLSKLAAGTTDETWVETFVTSSALDSLHKVRHFLLGRRGRQVAEERERVRGRKAKNGGLGTPQWGEGALEAGCVALSVRPWDAHKLLVRLLHLIPVSDGTVIC